MSLDPDTFIVHDIHEFPFVVFNQVAAKPGYAPQWEVEMVALLQNGQPFVVVYDQLRSDETHEDRKHRGVWLKHNKESLGRVCKALISIEPDEARRAEVKAMSEIAVKAFGIAQEVVATRDEAVAAARRLTASMVPAPVLEAARQIKGALVTHARTWDVAEVARVIGILQRTLAAIDGERP